MDIRLVWPSEEHEGAVMDYKREFLDNGDSMDGTANLRGAESYAQWLAAVRDNSDERTVHEGLVPASTFLALNENGALVGMIDVRRRLNDHLSLYGGHIGYSVRKSERRKGYATRMLALALDECRKLKIGRVLITCDRDNMASRCTILKNNGVMENEIPEGGRFTQRYWITLG